MQMSNLALSMTPALPAGTTMAASARGRFTVEVTRTWGRRTARAQVVYRLAPGEDPSEPLHAAAAGARAWFALGLTALDIGASRDALACALEGLEELGDDYATPDDEDDTGIRIAGARAEADADRPRRAARGALKALSWRLSLYADRFGVRINANH